MRNKETKNNLRGKPQSGLTRKAPGTRTGTLLDWRAGSIKSVSQHHGHTIRDGR
jgi:hypothetical protein